MTVAAIVIFATCIGSGIGFSFHSGLAMRAEERFFTGWIIGIVAFTWVAIVATRLFGFNGPAIAVATAATAALSLTGWRRAFPQCSNEWTDLRRRLRTSPLGAESPAPLVALCLVTWVLIADMFHNAYDVAADRSILVGHLASFSDWQAHLTYTASFAYAENTALNLPLATGYDIGYHGAVNFFAATLVPAGASLPGALQISGAFALFAFPGVMYSIGVRVFRDQWVALLGTVLFLFFGGWGWIELYRDVADPTVDVLPRFPRTYTRNPYPDAGNWWMENPVVGHFFPQRPTLIGFPVVLIVLGWLHSAWLATGETDGRDRSAMAPFLFCGVLVGLIPFFNLFAFGTPLAFVGLWWLVTKFDRRWLWFLIPAVVLAVPMVRFLQPPSSSLEFPYNWVAQVAHPGGYPADWTLVHKVGDWVLFWGRNLGLLLPLLLAAQLGRVLPKGVAVGLVPVWLWFIVPSLTKPHPWNGNNTHYFVFLILLGALPVAALLVNVARRFKVAAVPVALVVISMTLAGVVDVWASTGRVADPYPVTAMNSAAVSVGEWARTTQPESVFVIELGWPGGNVWPHQHPVPALSGRDVLVASDGWVNDLGIPDWATRKDHSRLILEAAPGHRELIDRYSVDYLVVGPPEVTPGWDANIAYWEGTADVVYRNAGWTVFRV